MKLKHEGVAGTRVHLPEIAEPVAFDERGVSEDIDDAIGARIAEDLAGYTVVAPEPAKGGAKNASKTAETAA